MPIIEDKIHALVTSIIPEHYVTDASVFVAFMEEYFKWLESDGQVLFHSRDLLENKDIDLTLDQFLVRFKEKYLSDIDFNTVLNKRQLIKYAQDLYRTKGTERGVKLFFQLIFGETPEVYYPAADLLKPSSGNYNVVRFLELEYSSKIYSLAQKTITGFNSGATAFCVEIIKRSVNGKPIYIASINQLVGNFIDGERVTVDNIIADAPIVKASLTSLTITDGTENHIIGDELEVIGTGANAFASVSKTTVRFGDITPELVDGGYGYTRNPSDIDLSDIIITSNGYTANSLAEYENVVLHETLTTVVANVTVISNATPVLALGETVTAYYANDDIEFQGVVVASFPNNTVGASSSYIYVNPTEGDWSNLDTDTLYGENNLYFYTTSHGSYVNASANISSISNNGITIGAKDVVNKFYKYGTATGQQSNISIIVNDIKNETVEARPDYNIFNTADREEVRVGADPILPSKDVLISANDYLDEGVFVRSGNSSTSIASLFAFNTITVGSIISIDPVTKGEGYQLSTTATLSESAAVALQKKDFVLGISNNTGNFITGEKITQNYVVNTSSITINLANTNEQILEGETLFQSNVAQVNNIVVEEAGINYVVGDSVTFSGGGPDSNTDPTFVAEASVTNTFGYVDIVKPLALGENTYTSADTFSQPQDAIVNSTSLTIVDNGDNYESNGNFDVYPATNSDFEITTANISYVAGPSFTYSNSSITWSNAASFKIFVPNNAVGVVNISSRGSNLSGGFIYVSNSFSDTRHVGNGVGRAYSRSHPITSRWGTPLSAVTGFKIIPESYWFINGKTITSAVEKSIYGNEDHFKATLDLNYYDQRKLGRYYEPGTAVAAGLTLPSMDGYDFTPGKQIYPLDWDGLTSSAPRVVVGNGHPDYANNSLLTVALEQEANATANAITDTLFLYVTPFSSGTNRFDASIDYTYYWIPTRSQEDINFDPLVAASRNVNNSSNTFGNTTGIIVKIKPYISDDHKFHLVKAFSRTEDTGDFWYNTNPGYLLRTYEIDEHTGDVLPTISYNNVGDGNFTEGDGELYSVISNTEWYGYKNINRIANTINIGGSKGGTVRTHDVNTNIFFSFGAHLFHGDKLILNNNDTDFQDIQGRESSNFQVGIKTALYIPWIPQRFGYGAYGMSSSTNRFGNYYTASSDDARSLDLGISGANKNWPERGDKIVLYKTTEGYSYYTIETANTDNFSEVTGYYQYPIFEMEVLDSDSSGFVIDPDAVFYVNEVRNGVTYEHYSTTRGTFANNESDGYDEGDLKQVFNGGAGGYDWHYANGTVIGTEAPGQAVDRQTLANFLANTLFTQWTSDTANTLPFCYFDEDTVNFPNANGSNDTANGDEFGQADTVPGSLFLAKNMLTATNTASNGFSQADDAGWNETAQLGGGDTFEYHSVFYHAKPIHRNNYVHHDPRPEPLDTNGNPFTLPKTTASRTTLAASEWPTALSSALYSNTEYTDDPFMFTSPYHHTRPIYSGNTVWEEAQYEQRMTPLFGDVPAGARRQTTLSVNHRGKTIDTEVTRRYANGLISTANVSVLAPPKGYMQHINGKYASPSLMDPGRLNVRITGETDSNVASEGGILRLNMEALEGQETAGYTWAIGADSRPIFSFSNTDVDVGINAINVNADLQASVNTVIRFTNATGGTTNQYEGGGSFPRTRSYANGDVYFPSYKVVTANATHIQIGELDAVPGNANDIIDIISAETGSFGIEARGGTVNDITILDDTGVPDTDNGYNFANLYATDEIGAILPAGVDQYRASGANNAANDTTLFVEGGLFSCMDIKGTAEEANFSGSFFSVTPSYILSRSDSFLNHKFVRRSKTYFANSTHKSAIEKPLVIFKGNWAGEIANGSIYAANDDIQEFALTYDTISNSNPYTANAYWPTNVYRANGFIYSTGISNGYANDGPILSASVSNTGLYNSNETDILIDTNTAITNTNLANVTISLYIPPSDDFITIDEEIPISSNATNYVSRLKLSQESIANLVSLNYNILDSSNNSLSVDAIEKGAIDLIEVTDRGTDYFNTDSDLTATVTSNTGTNAVINVVTSFGNGAVFAILDLVQSPASPVIILTEQNQIDETNDVIELFAAQDFAGGNSSANVVNDRILFSALAITLAEDDRVKYNAANSSLAITGLVDDTIYYVNSANDTHIALSETEDGNVISLGVGGDTTHSFTRLDDTFTVDSRVTYITSDANNEIGGITSGIEYYVVFANDTHIAIANTEGGSNIDITVGTANVETANHSFQRTTDYIYSGSVENYTNIDIEINENKPIESLNNGYTAQVNTLSEGTINAVASGIVYEGSNSQYMFVGRRSLKYDFVANNTILGETSNYTADVISVAPDWDRPVSGNNAIVNTNLSEANGILSEVIVLQSGIGYENNETVTLRSLSNTSLTAIATTNTFTQGFNKGEYKNTNGYLSSDKYLQDSFYWQEYSYDIKSSIATSKYESSYNSVMHAAGTKFFGSVVRNIDFSTPYNRDLEESVVLAFYHDGGRTSSFNTLWNDRIGNGDITIATFVGNSSYDDTSIIAGVANGDLTINNATHTGTLLLSTNNDHEFEYANTVVADISSDDIITYGAVTYITSNNTLNANAYVYRTANQASNQDIEIRKS